MNPGADILTFPGTTAPETNVQKVRSLSLTNYELDRLAEISEALAAAQLDIASSIRCVRAGNLLTDDAAAMNGETLHTVLSALSPLARLMGCRNEDRDLLIEVERWIEKREIRV